MKKILIIACVCIAFFVSGVSVYSYMNEKIVTHQLPLFPKSVMTFRFIKG